MHDNANSIYHSELIKNYDKYDLQSKRTLKHSEK